MNTDPRPTVRRLAVAGVGLAAALSLAGCAGAPGVSGTVTLGAPSSGASASAATASASSPDAAPSSGTGASSPSTTGPAPSPSASTSGYRASRCDAADLKGSLTDPEGAAGSTVYDLQLQNTGSRPCTLQGWPGVSLLTKGGEQIGAAATLDRNSPHQTVTLLPNGHAHAALKVARASNYPASTCRPEQAASLRVYPPGSKQSLRIATTITGCAASSAHLLDVQAFHATT